jgi:hypothetical protein
MALPGIDFTIEDGALGTLPPNVAGASVKIGVCSKGVPNTLNGYSDITSLRSDLGSGPLVEAIAQVLNVAGGPVYACPANPTTAGAVGATTHTGTGTGTLTGSLAPDRVIIAKVTTGGTLTTAQVAFSVDGGAYSTPVTTGAGPWTYAVPGTLTKLTFPAGTYVLNETYTFSTLGAMTQSGAGPVVTKAASPVDAYDVLVDIVTTGGLGSGAFIYSTDGGNNPSAVIAIPSGGGAYAIPGTGVVLTFAGSFIEGDTYAFSTTAAAATVGDITAALDAVHAQPTEWDHVHIVGTPTSAANAYTLAVAVDTKMVGMEAAFRYAYAVIECPTSEADSALISAFTPLGTTRVMVCAGDAALVSVINGRINRRNAAWVVTSRIALILQSEDPAWVGRGALPGVDSLYRDEGSTPGLDEQRFTTLRTHRGRNGYYITNARTMAPGGSDYTYITNRRVMDTACRITRAAELPYVNQDVLVDKTTGFIDEKEAQRFEADVNSQLRSGVVAPGLASDSRVVMSRTANLLGGQPAPVTVRVLPKAYLKNIDTNIGFLNPATA